MPGFIVQQDATVLCSHGAQATPITLNPRVKISGQVSVLATGPYTVAGCPFNVSGSPYPCVTGQWITFSTRVLSQGQPFVLQDSASVCTPTGTPMNIVATQVRVRAS
jgi:hypothetical protein